MWGLPHACELPERHSTSEELVQLLDEGRDLDGGALLVEELQGRLGHQVARLHLEAAPDLSEELLRLARLDGQVLCKLRSRKAVKVAHGVEARGGQLELDGGREGQGAQRGCHTERVVVPVASRLTGTRANPKVVLVQVGVNLADIPLQINANGQTPTTITGDTKGDPTKRVPKLHTAPPPAA